MKYYKLYQHRNSISSFPYSLFGLLPESPQVFNEPSKQGLYSKLKVFIYQDIVALPCQRKVRLYPHCHAPITMKSATMLKMRIWHMARAWISGDLIIMLEFDLSTWIRFQKNTKDHENETLQLLGIITLTFTWWGTNMCKCNTSNYYTSLDTWKLGDVWH